MDDLETSNLAKYMLTRCILGRKVVGRPDDPVDAEWVEFMQRPCPEVLLF